MLFYRQETKNVTFYKFLFGLLFYNFISILKIIMILISWLNKMKLICTFLLGAFLEKRVDYSHGFSAVLLRPPELTKIVLPKVLQNFKFHLLAQGTEPKSFPHNIQCRTRQKGPPFSFFGIAKLFFREKMFPQSLPPSIFFGFCDRLGIEKSQRIPPFNFFGVVSLFSKKILVL